MLPILYTVGHSSHTLKEFIALLKTYKITHLIDIRTIPKSRYVPWFNEKKLKATLQKEKILYIHMPKLGGLRRTNKNSINNGWINASFRGFADYMQTHEFYLGIKELNIFLKNRHKVVIMCAEALPWRCHRSLIADAEVVRKIKVLHIMSATSIRAHEITAFAKVDRKKRPIKIYYP